MATNANSKASNNDGGQGETKTWSFSQKDSDPAFSDARWTQFTKGGTATSSPSKENGSPSLTSSTPPGGAATLSPTTMVGQPAPVATSPTSGAGSDSLRGNSTAAPPAAAMVLNTSSPMQQQQNTNSGGNNNEATILYPVGTGANGAPLFIAITPSQLAATGGNPQLLLNGLGGNHQLFQQSSQQQQNNNQQAQQNQQMPHQMQMYQQQPSLGSFTASQHIISPSAASTPVMASTPLASTPMNSSNLMSNTAAAAPPTSTTTTNPIHAGVQMMIPPGMSIPVPVPLSTVHIKSQVGTPKYTGTNIPQPSPHGSHGMGLPPQQMQQHQQQQMMMYGPPTPTSSHQMNSMSNNGTPMNNGGGGGGGPTPTLLQINRGGGSQPMMMSATTPPGNSPMSRGNSSNSNNNHNNGQGGAFYLMQPVGSSPASGSPTLGQQNKQVMDEQQIWAANEHLFKAGQAPPALASNPTDLRSQSSNNTRSQDVTPQAGSVRGGGKHGGERSNGPTPKGLSSRATPSAGGDRKSGNNNNGGGGGKMSRQEMLMQALEARDPSTTLPAPKPVETDDLLTEEQKIKRRQDLEEKLLGKKEDEASCVTPSAASPLAGSSGAVGVVGGAGGGVGGPSSSASSTPVAAWKAKPCKSFIQTGQCRYGDKCVFAHGVAKS